MNTIIKIDNQSPNRNALIGDIKLDNKCSHTTVIYSNLDIEPKWDDVFGNSGKDLFTLKDNIVSDCCSASYDIHISFLQKALIEDIDGKEFKFMYLFNHQGK